jgi:hypothetical protein
MSLRTSSLHMLLWAQKQLHRGTAPGHGETDPFRWPQRTISLHTSIDPTNLKELDIFGIAHG